MEIFLIAVAASIISIPIVLLGVAVKRAGRPIPKAWHWLTDFAIPLATPVIVGLLGILFAIKSDIRQREEAERQRQTSVMRELIISQDRADTSFLLAIDAQLSHHLHRYHEGARGFNEEAAFFFYGMHRAALVNLRATEGNLVFPRLWMEDTFANLANHVGEVIVGATEEGELTFSPEGEAVMYQYFGTRSSSNRKEGERDRQADTGPLLFQFHCLLHDIINPTDPAAVAEKEALRREFGIFRTRLDAKKVAPTEVINTIFAMDALRVYAYNNTFASWYETHPKPIPQVPPLNPPKDFAPDHSEQNRQIAWKLIREFSPSK